MPSKIYGSPGKRSIPAIPVLIANFNQLQHGGAKAVIKERGQFRAV
jgi:hypothetical protein